MIYGVVTFFFCAIPLMAEGDAIMALSRVHNSTIDVMCSLNPRELRERTNKYTYSLFEMAHKMDDVSQYLLDNYMCTNVCPCREMKTGNHSDQAEFYWLDEKLLNSHNRTMIGKEGFTPFYWVNDTHHISFESF